MYLCCFCSTRAHPEPFMDLCLSYQPHRRLQHTSSWGRFSHLRKSSKAETHMLVGVPATNGFVAHTRVTFGKSLSQSVLKPRCSLGVSNADPGFDRRKNASTTNGYDTISAIDRPVKLDGMIHENRDQMKDVFTSAGHLWQESHLEERGKDLCEFLDQLKEFRKKMEGMIKKGDKDTVVALVKANHKSLMEQLDEGNKGLEQAAMLEILVQLLMVLQDVAVVPQMLGQMKDILMSIEVYEPFLDAFLEHMGSVYLVLGNKEEALTCYKRSLDLQESILGQDSPQLVGTLLVFAGAYTEPEERKLGKVIYNRIVAILESSKGKTCEDLGAPLLHLGYIFLEEKNSEEAELCIRRALNIAEQNNGKGGSVGVAICALARAKHLKGDHAKAAELYQNGISLLKNSGYWSNGDLAIESIRMEAAEFFSVVGRTKEAQDLWEEVLHEKERVVGVNSPRLVVHLQNLATSYAQDGRFDRCEPLLRRSLKLVTASMGPTAPQVSIPLEYLATTLHHLDQNREAESLARQALSIRERNFPDDHLLIGEACNLLASILHANSKNSEALALAQRALHIKEKHLGKNNKELAFLLDLILDLLDSLGKSEDAMQLMDRMERLIGSKARP